MIDSHCHLEQKDFEPDLEQVIGNCKAAGLKALITSCAHPKDFERTLQIAKQFPGFVFPVAGLHPEYIKEISPTMIDEYFEKIEKNSAKIFGIGEVGLDYFYVKEPDWQEKQKGLFVRFIELAKELKKPLIIHSRNAYPETIGILEQSGIEKVQLHMWGGRGQIQKILLHEWLISVGPIIATSKTYKKIIRDFPLEKIMLETDSPWFGSCGRGEPTNIKIPCKEIAEIKKLSFDEVWRQCGENAAKFYNIPLESRL